MEVSNIIDTTEDEVSRTAAWEVYDSKGTPHNVHFKFEKIAAGDGVIVEDGESINGTFWRVMVATNPEFEPVEVSDETGETEINEPVSYCLFFDQDGRLRKVKTEEVTEVPSSVSDWDDRVRHHLRSNTSMRAQNLLNPSIWISGFNPV